jgi:hypothetical protein
MKNIFRHKVLAGAFVMILALVVGFVSFTNEAHAAAITASASGNWNATTTWTPAQVPVAGDAVTIPVGFTVTVTAPAAAATVSVSDPVGTSNGLTISSGQSLTLTGALTIVGSSTAQNSTINVGAGTLSAAGISITGGTSTGASIVSLTTGSITTSAGITFAGAQAVAQLTVTGAGSITLTGTVGIGTGGTVALNAASTVNFNGTTTQPINVYTYGNLTVNNTTGTATMATGTIPVAGNLTVTSGILDMASSVPTVTGTTTVSSGGTLLLSSLTGLKTFTGDVTVASGGIWNETAAVAVSHAGSLTNNGTYTGSTGIHTFTGTGKTLTGTIAIPNLTISGTTTNAGVLTVSTALAGASTLTNGATGTLNLGGTNTATLVANTVGNTVVYNGGAQTVTIVPYYNLTLANVGTKTVGGALTVANATSIAPFGLAVANLTGSSTTNTLAINGTGQAAGSYGFTGSGATNINTTYFLGSGMITAAAGSVPVLPGAINLGTSANFAILAKTLISDGNPSISAITGNVGVSPAAGSSIASLSCTEVSQKIYDVDGTYTGGHNSNVTCLMPGPGANKTLVDNAVLDMGTAYTAASSPTTPAGVGANLNVGAGTLNGQTFVPGTYTWLTNTSITGDITLSGGASSVWVFQVTGTLTLNTNKHILLSGGALASNIFWQVTGTTALQAGSTFEGTILDQTNITMGASAILNGRALAQTAVTLLGDTVVTPPASSTPVVIGGGAGLTNQGGSNTTTTTNNNSTSTSTTPTVTVTPIFTPIVTVTNYVPGCMSNVGFSITTGQSCYNNTVFNQMMSIPGCNNGTMGFSVSSGMSCVNNLVTQPTVIAGCNNGTNGFSITSGISCANNMMVLNSQGENAFPKSYDFGTATLKNGSRGEAVEELQEFLNRFLNLGLMLDGNLGPKTIASIKKWQMQNGLVADGLVGAKTKMLMNTWAATR